MEMLSTAEKTVFGLLFEFENTYAFLNVYLNTNILKVVN